MASGEGFGLALRFDSGDPEFARGFEAGRLWQQLDTGDAIEQAIHASNAEMTIRMCEATGRRFGAERLDDTWVFLHIGEAG